MAFFLGVINAETKGTMTKVVSDQFIMPLGFDTSQPNNFPSLNCCKPNLKFLPFLLIASVRCNYLFPFRF